MRTGHYTRLKGRVTYFRRKIPEFLQARLESSEICYRIGVVSSKVAERLGRKLAVEVDMLFEDARTNPMLNAADLTQLVETAMLGWRKTSDTDIAEGILRHGMPRPNPRDSATSMAEMGMGLIQRNGVGASAFDAPFVVDMAERAGLPALSDDVALVAGGRALSMGLAAHYLRSAVEIASMHGLAKGWRGLPVKEWQGRLAALEQHLGLDGDSADDLSTPGQAIALTSDDEAEVVLATASAVTEPPVAIDAAPANGPLMFSELVALCLDQRIADKEVKVSIRADMKSSLKIWLQVAGDRPISEYKRADFTAYKSVLQKVPEYYWRSDASRKLTILEVIEAKKKQTGAAWREAAGADERDNPEALERASQAYARLTNDTVNKHLSTIAPVFKWAVINEHLPYDTWPFWNDLQLKTGVKITGMSESDERPPYSHEQILQIAKHPVWTGQKSGYYYNEPGKVIVRNSLYWGFPVALLHGMRLEEFAQLKVKHVRQIDGVWIFDLHEIEIDVKRPESHRYVPLHSKLFAIGFLEAMVLGRPPEERLFKELSKKGELDKFGSALGKRFARVLNKLGIIVIRKNGTKSKGCFHPLRHRFITDLLKAGGDGFVVAVLTGHKPNSGNGEQDRYREKPSIAKLKETIEMLPMVVDFDPWIEAWKRYGKH